LRTLIAIQIIISSLFFNIDAQNFIVENGDTINYTTSNNNKQGFWKNKELRTEGNYTNNEKNGVWKSFYKNANIKSEITYINGKKRGFAKIYYEDGQIAEEGTWMEDKWTGKYKSYYKNGKLSYVWNYSEHGNRCGYQKYFYENGNIKIEGEWTEGKESGLIKEYYSSGVLKSKKLFCEGRCDKNQISLFKEKDSVLDIVEKTTTNIVTSDTTISKHTHIQVNQIDSIKTFKGTGEHVLYNKDRKPEKEGEFVNGILIKGKHYFYNEDGTLLKTAIYKSGKLIEIILN